MSSEWYRTTLGDICSKVFSGGTPTSTNSTYYDGGTIPWLRTKEVNYGKIYETEEHITEVGFENSSAKLVPVNSVIVAMYGNGDTAGRVAVNKVPITTNQACCNLVVDTSKADYRFVYYYLMGQYQALVDLKNGGAQQNLNGQLIKAFPISLPTIAEQVEISNVLESLDDRITLLRETNTTLEAIAQALFKSWFVDFDPVHAKMQGRAPEGMDEATAALFPDSFEESELGDVPKGWSTGKLADIASLKGGKMLDKTSFSDSGANPVFGGAGVMGFSDLSNSEGFVITVGRVGAYCGQYFWHQGRAWVNNNASLVSPINPDDSCWLFLWLKNVDMDLIKKGAAQPFVSNGDISDLKIVLPPSFVVDKFVQFVEPIFQKLSLIREKTQCLEVLRDTLLPRLISGQLSLKDCQATLAA